ncbi:SDR family NAD(P)-dependent oxidoreductase [Leucobacter albus]|uniref:SDR family NAD(P)-dependent oxidoreductase n=1 Tax=Leucobacter albus TaxID=272210 RepID=A0ABW3TS28_9MICO
MTSAELDQRVVIVTGAARGLGAVIAECLEQASASVVRVDIAGGDFAADISTAAGNEAMVAHALQLHGRLDGIVLNAGVQHVRPLTEFPEEQWDRLHGVMLKGPFLGLQAAWPALAASGTGRAVIVSSTSAIAAEPDKSAYVSAKAGVMGLVRATAVEGGRDGVAVNAVLPGWMRTEMAEAQLRTAVDGGLDRAEAEARMFARQPVKRFVETGEVAAAVRFLLSPAASGITGVGLPVDLGLLAQ